MWAVAVTLPGLNTTERSRHQRRGRSEAWSVARQEAGDREVFVNIWPMDTDALPDQLQGSR